MTTVFITGASGYIGGDVLSVLVSKYPDLHYRLLVRSRDSGQKIKAQYPTVEIIQGDLDNSETLAAESARADIIIPKAIAQGALEGHTEERPVYWLHTSGAGIFSFSDTENKVYGEKGEKIYDDVQDIHEIVNFPDHAFHRDVDKAVLEAGSVRPGVLKTAIVSPVTVYGRGRGPCSQRSRQIYELAKLTIQRQKVPIIGRGLSFATDIHIEDLTSLYVILFEKALSKQDDGLWGPEAYYLSENGEHCWGELARSIGQICVAEGFIPNAEEEAFGFEDARKWAGYEAASWGLNVRCRASRARQLLGWQPSAPSLESELRDIVKGEYCRLQEAESSA
ncbi:nucleoside-diphosphate-sugar epimerase [Aspergillus luchuensis IFO 4308]|nr:nucleoside-diphosphate-sugar epimerase [Aspergillus luchuensis IFO 4308]